MAKQLKELNLSNELRRRDGAENVLRAARAVREMQEKYGMDREEIRAEVKRRQKMDQDDA